MNVEDVRRIAVPACQRFGVKRLDAFGSVARGTPSLTGDVDLLVQFKDPENSLSRRFFDLLHDLEDALHCPVDLLTVEGLRNPSFRRRVFSERVNVYEG
jgi:hypothetical protein